MTLELRLLWILFCCVIAMVCTANEDQDTWFPHEHPATVERRITAFTAPSRSLELSAEFQGRVESISVYAGDTVDGRAGKSTPVVILDNRFATISKNRAKTALDKAVQQKEQLEVELALAGRQLEYHQNEVKRIESLASSGKVRKSDLDAAVFNADTSALQTDKAKTALLLAETAILDARHTLAEVEERLARHIITAPAGWVVLERLVEPGAIVGPGETLLRLADLEELAIEFRLSEDEIVALEKKKNIAVLFSRQNYPNAKARIHRIDVDHDPVTNKRLVELRIPGDSAPSRSGGLEVFITLSLPDPGGLVRVPRDFLTQRFEQHFVTLKGGNELAVVPLRLQGNHVLISKQDIPDAITLIRPQGSPH